MVAIALSSLVYIGFTLFLLYGALTQGFSSLTKEASRRRGGRKHGRRGGYAGYSQPRRLKTRYRVTEVSTMRARAKGYPMAQCSSGMLSKFIP